MNDERSTDRLAPAAVEPGMFHGAVERLTATVTEWPVATLWAVFFLTILSLGITVRFLSFRTDRSDLLDPRTDYHQRWLTFKEKFGDDSDVVIVVEADQTEQIKMVLDALGQRLEAEPDLFDRVLYRVDPTALKKKALQYLRPSDLEAVNARLEMYAPILAGHWNRAGIESYCLRLSEFLNQATKANSNVADGIIRQSRDLSLSLLQFLESPAQFASPWPEMIPAAAFPKSEQFEAEYQIASSGRMGFLLVLPRDVGKTFSGASTSLTRLREIVAEATDQFPEATIGLTGIPVLEADEMARSQQDMTVASIISFLGVGIILLIGFRGFRHPLLALMMLAVGIAWSLGYTTVVVGHLNILSVSFAAILIGLGIDFAIHYLARYLELRHHGHSLQEALVTASKTTGSGIITASITTALAFFCATFTNFLGISELGIIAGGGVLICTLVTFLVLPALIVRADRNREPRQLPTPFEGNLLRRATREHPRLVGGVSLACIIAIACQGVVWRDGQIASRVKYDYNLLNLQAQGLPSVDLQQRLFEESNGSLLYAVSLASSPQETRALKKHFLELPSVMRVEELGSYLPTYPPEETNLLVQAIHARLSRISDFPREFPQIDPLSIGRSIESLYQSLNGNPSESAQEAAKALDRFLTQFEQMELEQQMRLLGGYQQAMLMALHTQLQTIATISDPDPVSPDDFPDAVRERFVSPQGDWLVRVHPSQQIWDEQPLTEFVTDVRTVDPEITGTPLQNFEAARQIQKSYLNSAFYALAVIIVVLLIDSLTLGPLLLTLFAPIAVVGYAVASVDSMTFPRDVIWLLGIYVGLAMLTAAIFDIVSIRNTLLTLLPPVCGLLLMFGILGMLGVHFNPANLIVLPLILGIGVDDGVHVVHDFRMQPGRYQTSPSTINAIALTSLTSMVGFGSMLVSSHQGLVSLGIVLVVGVGSCLFVSLVFLPAVLTLITSHRAMGNLEIQPDTFEEATGDAEIIALPQRVRA